MEDLPQERNAAVGLSAPHIEGERRKRAEAQNPQAPDEGRGEGGVDEMETAGERLRSGIVPLLPLYVIEHRR